MENAIKYPHTYHLPFSQGLQNDDKRMEDEHCFDGKDIAITIKMDGENTTMYRDGMHARSLYAMSHPSQHWVKAYHASIAHLIPEGWRICGENLYARHSIVYEELESFFQVFSIWDENNVCLDLDSTLYFCSENGLHHVEVVDKIHGFEYHEMKAIEAVYNLEVQLGHEGIVVRNLSRYPFSDFQNNVAKAVRKGHVQTDEHWTKTWVPNKLRG